MDIVQAAIKENPWIASLCILALVFLPSLSKAITSFLRYIVGMILSIIAMILKYDRIKVADIEISKSKKQQEEKEEDRDRSSNKKVINFQNIKDERQK